ncbi:hypothetical protein HYC85_026295 [Camellia sinensis]|uniref:Alkaline/neutral invertase n=1 Tax=Camellia sinensis TaxID=4442 RepID=A0A7J7G781_CAMSI|nr:hypothetical protein HYC85_026295 [Camellia sinensis]
MDFITNCTGKKLIFSCPKTNQRSRVLKIVVLAMGTPEAVMQVLGGALPRLFFSDKCFSISDSDFLSKSFVKYRKRRGSKYMQLLNCSSKLRGSFGNHWFPAIGKVPFGNTLVDRSVLISCNCQQAESVSGATSANGNRTWYVDNAKKLSTINGIVNGPDILDFEKVQESKQETEVFTSNGNAPAAEPVRDTLHKVCVDSIEDEAWELLWESMVYYCGSPIGTIAAKDPTSSTVLNYDQVFIRDFIPSGIAFLLKEEYDIVRNFILHTLQLQSWEKTMDCHSPGQGLMPASFKVRTVPLHGDDSATEEVLDPDFGEAAIGRVAPVDSGLWWIILLRAYGKCSGDLSVQERIDVQTGIKMILRLCLADGFDMFPTLLVTDGSCMIDRRMGIHGHPLEIQVSKSFILLCVSMKDIANANVRNDCPREVQEMVNVQAAAIESGTPLTQEEISRQVLGQKKRYLLGFGSGPQPSTIFATRAHDKDMEAMRAEVEALREERQKDHDELMKEREERERCYNKLLKEREERIQLSNEMLKEREEGQKARDETNTKVEHLNNVVAKLSQLLGI